MAVHQRSVLREERGRDLGQSVLDHADQRGRHGHAQVQDAVRDDDANGAGRRVQQQQRKWKTGTADGPPCWTRIRYYYYYYVIIFPERTPTPSGVRTGFLPANVSGLARKSQEKLTRIPIANLETSGEPNQDDKTNLVDLSKPGIQLARPCHI